MAKANWVNVSPSSGSGNATVNVSSREHTGRVVRTTILTWKATNVADIQRTVNQAGKPEYVDVDDAASADKAGVTALSISGRSNSQKLTFSLGTGNLNITLPSTYVANSITTNNGAAISGDPGASAEYDFSITLSVPANNTTLAMSRQIIVTDSAGHQDVCTLTSAAGDAYLTVQAGNIELDYKGTAVAVSVESNTNWTVE